MEKIENILKDIYSMLQKDALNRSMADLLPRMIILIILIIIMLIVAIIVVYRFYKEVVNPSIYIINQKQKDMIDAKTRIEGGSK